MRARVSTFGLSTLLAGLALHTLPSFAAAPNGECGLTLQDKRANAALSFIEFDQEGSTPTSARSLARRGCFKEAADAVEDYLITGVVEDIHQQRLLRFHQGQYLASAGDEAGAARIVAGTKDPEQSRDAYIDWNSYVDGTWAFLVKDRAILDASYDALVASTGSGDILNRQDLARLRQCFDRSYLDATTSAECAARR